MFKAVLHITRVLFIEPPLRMFLFLSRKNTFARQILCPNIGEQLDTFSTNAASVTFLGDAKGEVFQNRLKTCLWRRVIFFRIWENYVYNWIDYDWLEISFQFSIWVEFDSGVGCRLRLMGPSSMRCSCLDWNVNCRTVHVHVYSVCLTMRRHKCQTKPASKSNISPEKWLVNKLFSSGWWFQPIWKILVKMGIFPK